MNITTFIDRLLELKEIKFLRYSADGETQVYIFEAPDNRIVLIDASEDEIDEEDIRVYLRQLGCNHYFEMFCPHASTTIIADEIDAINSGSIMIDDEDSTENS